MNTCFLYIYTYTLAAFYVLPNFVTYTVGLAKKTTINNFYVKRNKIKLSPFYDNFVTNSNYAIKEARGEKKNK